MTSDQSRFAARFRELSVALQRRMEKISVPALNAPRRRLRWSDVLTPSAAALVLANLVPVFGILALDWKVLPILLLFWVENLVIGFFNVAKMACARPADVIDWLTKAWLIPFFCVHYGIFCLVHGIFILALFGGGEGAFDGSFPGPRAFARAVVGAGLIWPALSLLASHGVSFVANYLRKGEYRNVSPAELMGRPYGRIIIMQMTILGGGFMAGVLGSPAWALVVLVAMKIFQDLRAHVRERDVMAAGGVAERCAGEKAAADSGGGVA